MNLGTNVIFYRNISTTKDLCKNIPTVYDDDDKFEGVEYISLKWDNTIFLIYVVELQVFYIINSIQYFLYVVELPVFYIINCKKEKTNLCLFHWAWI